jgi:hypothetical protein
MTATKKQQHQLTEIKSCLDWNSAKTARGYRYRDFLSLWDCFLFATSLPGVSYSALKRPT